MKRHFFVLMAVAVTSAVAYAGDLDSIAPYPAPARPLYGDLRIFDAGHVDVVTRWIADFSKFHKAVLLLNPGGTSSAIGTLYAGVNDVAFVPRSAFAREREAYIQVVGREPLAIKVGYGSFDGESLSPVVAVFVNRDNPISKLTYRQLDGIFGAQRTGGLRELSWSKGSARSSSADIRTWGQLGLTGEWTDKAIHTLGYDLTICGFAFTFQEQVMQGGDTWNPGFIEFPLGEPGRYDVGAVHKAGGHGIAAGVAEDRYAIGFANPQYAKGNAVKMVALAVKDGGPYVEPTLENCKNRSYLLTSPLYLYANGPGMPTEDLVNEFARFVLSRQGQKDLLEGGQGYLPLNPGEIEEELKKLPARSAGSNKAL